MFELTEYHAGFFAGVASSALVIGYGLLVYVYWLAPSSAKRRQPAAPPGEARRALRVTRAFDYSTRDFPETELLVDRK